MRKRTLKATGVAAAAALLAACGSGAGGNTSQVVITTYGTGTATYADMAAVANALTKTDGTKTRIITSDTAIGRMTPLKQGQAQFARTGDEYIFAFNGEYEFATKEWGPQDVRVEWAPTAPHSWMVKDNSPITTAADLRGKKVPRITANPSVNNKTETMLATAGLTWDDVDAVDIGYSEQPDGLKAGKLDVLFQQVYGSSLFELESSTPVRWLEFDAEDPKVVDAVEKGSPSVEFKEFTEAPGQKDGKPDVGFQYAVPLITYAKTDEAVAYKLAKGIVNSYDDYKDSTSTTGQWSIDASVIIPKQVPFHDGLIKLLEEQNKWTPEAQARQDELLARGEKLRQGWKEVSGSASDAELASEWAAWKQQNLTP